MVNSFPKRISTKVNVKALQEFENVHKDGTVRHIIHNGTEIPPQSFYTYLKQNSVCFYFFL